MHLPVEPCAGADNAMCASFLETKHEREQQYLCFFWVNLLLSLANKTKPGVKGKLNAYSAAGGRFNEARPRNYVSVRLITLPRPACEDARAWSGGLGNGSEPCERRPSISWHQRL